MNRPLASVTLAGVALAGLALAAAPAARAVPIVFTASLDGPSESPPNVSPGTGFAIVTYDDAGHTLRVQASFSDLTGATTAAHIHASTAVAGAGNTGVATTTPSFPGFPLGVTAGVMDQTFDLTLVGSFNGAFVTASGGTTAAAELALIQAMVDGKAYFNIHTGAFPAGEIRGFLAVVTAAVPEPASLALVGLGLGMIAMMRRRRAG